MAPASPEGDLGGGIAGQTDATRCVRCGGRIEPDWAVCGWCGRHVDHVAAAAPTPGASPAPRPDDRDGADAVVLGSGVLLLQGRYRIDTLLGRGGFGITYRARDTRLHRDVAVKELFPPGAHRLGETVVVADTDRAAFETARARFQREAATLARFNHPGIVRIFEVFEANDTAYLVMELIDGSSVGELLSQRGTPYSVTVVLDMVLRVGGALGAVHDAGLLHRDINPSNLMVDGSRRIVLIDFGLARRYGEDISGSLTRAVTPGYAPPEQYAGSARSGPPCDVFGLAATAYKLLTGVTPVNVFDRQAGAVLPAPIELRPEIPPLVSAAILDGMELDATHRPASTEAFLHRLGLFAVEPGPRVFINSPDEPDPTSELARVARTPKPRPGASARPGAAGWPGAVQAPPMAAHNPPAVATPAPAPPSAARPGPVVPPGSPVGVRGAAGSPGAGSGGPSFAPWHDGAPPTVGPAARWRGWATWPAAVALVVLTSASPLVVSALLAFVVLPGIATAGDVEVHRYRRRTGGSRRRWHDAQPAVVVPVRFVRNLAVSAARALPAVAVAAIGFATEQVFSDGAPRELARDLTIRLCGVAMALVLFIPSRRGGRGFRTDLGLSAWANWATEGRHRPSPRTFVLWVVALAVVAFGAWLDPELWPLT